MPVNHNVESRLAKTETELEALSRDIGLITSDVRSLATSVRSQGEQFDVQLRQLHIAVTAASAPRKTDWQVVLFGIGLAISIGTAALSPMYARLSDLNTIVERQEARFEEHTKLKLHPVGESRINALDEKVNSNLSVLKDEVVRLVEDINDTKDKSVPSIMERLAVIEEKMKIENQEQRKINREPH